MSHSHLIAFRLVGLIKLCLNEIYSSAQLGNYWSNTFISMNGLGHGDVLSPLLLNFALDYAITRVQVNKGGLILNDTYHISLILLV